MLAHVPKTAQYYFEKYSSFDENFKRKDFQTYVICKVRNAISFGTKHILLWIEKAQKQMESYACLQFSRSSAQVTQYQ